MNTLLGILMVVVSVVAGAACWLIPRWQKRKLWEAALCRAHKTKEIERATKEIERAKAEVARERSVGALERQSAESSERLQRGLGSVEGVPGPIQQESAERAEKQIPPLSLLPPVGEKSLPADLAKRLHKSPGS